MLRVAEISDGSHQRISISFVRRYLKVSRSFLVHTCYRVVRAAEYHGAACVGYKFFQPFQIHDESAVSFQRVFTTCLPDISIIS